MQLTTKLNVTTCNCDDSLRSLNIVECTWRSTAVLAALLFVVSLAGCAGKSPEEVVVTKAGDREITAGLFAAYIKQVAKGTPEQLDQAYRERLLQQLVQLTLAADREVALADKKTAAQAELQRLELYAKAGAARAGVFAAPTQAELQQAYDAFVKGQPAAEFRVAHILVPTENMALGIIRQLGQGKDFANLARNQSADDSRSRGGELGWIHPGPLPKEFTDAVAALKIGQYTTQPVKTPYGWHVIRLLETRSATVPPLADVQAQLVVNLQQQRYENFLKAK